MITDITGVEDRGGKFKSSQVIWSQKVNAEQGHNRLGDMSL